MSPAWAAAHRRRHRERRVEAHGRLGGCSRRGRADGRAAVGCQPAFSRGLRRYPLAGAHVGVACRRRRGRRSAEGDPVGTSLGRGRSVVCRWARSAYSMREPSRRGGPLSKPQHGPYCIKNHLVSRSLLVCVSRVACKLPEWCRRANGVLAVPCCRHTDRGRRRALKQAGRGRFGTTYHCRWSQQQKEQEPARATGLYELAEQNQAKALSPRVRAYPHTQKREVPGGGHQTGG